MATPVLMVRASWRIISANVNVEMFTGSLNAKVTIPMFISRLNAIRVGLLVSGITSSACSGTEGGNSMLPAISLTSSSVTTM